MKTILEKNIPNIQASTQCAKQIYEDFLKKEKNFTLFLEGGLGAGKTFFIRELLRCFGVKQEIPSPTYVFLAEYEVPHPNPLPKGEGVHRFAHFDFYRLKSPHEFFARGFADIAADNTISKYIEWPDKVSDEIRRSFSGTRFTLHIEYGIGVGMRKIKLLQ